MINQTSAVAVIMFVFILGGGIYMMWRKIKENDKFIETGEAPAPSALNLNEVKKAFSNLGPEPLVSEKPSLEKMLPSVSGGLYSNSDGETLDSIKKERDQLKLALEKEVSIRGKAASVSEYQDIQELNVRLERSGQALQNLTEEIHRLEQKRADFKNALKLKDERIQELESSIDSLKDDYESKIEAALERVLDMDRKIVQLKGDLSKNFESNYFKQSESLEDVVRQRDDALKNLGSMKDQFEDLKEQTDHLLEKDKLLQYELSKFRAHSVGLERLCEDFRNRIESYADDGRVN